MAEPRSGPARQRRQRALRAALGALACAAAVSLLAHLPSVQALFGASSCPFDPSARAPAPTTLEDFRVKSLSSLRSERAAASHQALAFELGRSQRSDVVAWSARFGLSCTDEVGGAALRCAGPASLVEDRAIEDVFFRFDPDARLVAVDVMHLKTTAARAAEVVARVTDGVGRTVGSPSAVHGTPSAEHLSGGRLSRVAFEYRFADYAADVSATSFAEGNAVDEAAVAVREQYRLLVPTAIR